MSIVDKKGNRLYLNAEERSAFVRAAENEPREIRALCLLMHDTGIRESEVLEITPARFDLDARTVTIRSLKKRREDVYRTIPVSPDTMKELNLIFALRETQGRGGKEAHEKLWDVKRITVYRHIVRVMKLAGIAEGPHRVPKGLRHGFGVHAVSSGVPLNMLQKWMGHTDMKTTAIYANAVGKEEYGIAERMWQK